MTPTSRLLVLEPVLGPGDDPHPGKLLDIVQLALHRGGVRTEAEFERLFQANGLRLSEARRLWPSSPTDLIVAVPS
jgi:hypothetical protein